MLVLFPGSFDPFTDGHANIVKRALQLFDGVVVAVGENSDKRYLFSSEERVQKIAERYADEPAVSQKTIFARSITKSSAGTSIGGSASAKVF